uniref:Uncharacterized protein n=1 Tax=Panagrolaimus superbus TaxID=310955 RepID=A0A914Y3D1_9BILA
MKGIFSLAILALIATVVLCAPSGQNAPPPMPLPQPPLMAKRQNYQQQQPYGNNYYRDNSREDWSPEDAYKYQMKYNNANGYNQVNPYGQQQYNPSGIGMGAGMGTGGYNSGMGGGMNGGYNSGYRGSSSSNQYPYNSQSQGYYQG